VVTANDTFQADVAIREGKIVALGQGLREAGSSMPLTTSSCRAGWMLMSISSSRGRRGSSWAGTRAAVWGGNTTVMPFCLQQKGQSLRAALSDYHARAAGIAARVAPYFSL